MRALWNIDLNVKKAPTLDIIKIKQIHYLDLYIHVQRVSCKVPRLIHV